MISIVAKRLALFVVVIVLVSLGTLFLLDHVPGNAAQLALGADASPAQVHAYEHTLGLDRSFVSRYGNWMGGIARGDLGRSLINGEPVTAAIRRAWPVTVEISIFALVLALVTAIPLALWSAYRAGGVVDRSVLVASSTLVSVPSFLMAVGLVYVVALRLRWLPLAGWVPFTDDPVANLRHALLPSLALAGVPAAVFVRVLRNDIVQTLREDYIASARARGLSTFRVLFHHALRPSMFSLVTVAGITLGALLGGTILIEAIFSLPGLGQVAFAAIQARDYVTIRAVVLLFATVYVALNAVVDLSYVLLDPRVRT